MANGFATSTDPFIQALQSRTMATPVPTSDTPITTRSAQIDTTRPGAQQPQPQPVPAPTPAPGIQDAVVGAVADHLITPAATITPATIPTTVSGALPVPEIVSASRVPATAPGIIGGPVVGTAAGVAGVVGMADIINRFDETDRTIGGVARGVGQGAASGAAVGNLVAGPVGAGIGAVIGGITGIVGTLTNSGRHVDHERRSSFRDAISTTPLTTTNQTFFQRPQGLGGRIKEDAIAANMAPGQEFNPTGTYVRTAKGKFFDVSGERGRAGYNVDPTRPFVDQAIGWVAPIAEILTGGDPMLSTAFAGYLANAAMSDAETMEGVRANALKFFGDLGFSPEDATKALGELQQAGKITQQEMDAMVNSIGTMIKGDPNLYVTQPIAAISQAVIEPDQAPVPMPRGGLGGAEPTPMPTPRGGAPGALPVTERQQADSLTDRILQRR